MNRRDRIALAIVAATTALAIFAIGGAPRWSQAAVAISSSVGLTATWSSRRAFDRCPVLLVFLLAAAAWSLVQLVPLPEQLVHAASPVLDDLRNDGADLAGVSVSSTLSMDPSATLCAVIFFITLSAVAVAALRLSVSERGRYTLLACVAGFAGLTGITAGAHALFDASSLYGVYRPRQLPPILGPLINPNHLGCLTAVGAVISIGLLLYAKQSVKLRILWAFNAVGCVVATTATLSRGALIALCAGLMVMLAVTIAQQFSRQGAPLSRRRREQFLVTTLPIGVVVTCALVVAVYLGANSVMSQLSNTTFDELNAPRTKYAAWRASERLVEESPWVGVGRGAFESSFTRVHAASAYATFSHPENELVQAVVEWGIPASLALAIIAGWVLLRSIRRWRDGPLAAGALGAMMIVGFQSNFDFGVELLGVAVPVTVILATLTYVPIREFSGRRLRRIRVTRLAHIAAIAIGAFLLFTNETRSIADDHDRLRVEPSSRLVAESIEAHPLDYFGFGLLAENLSRTSEGDAVRVLNHALRLHPTHSGLHRIAARLLVRSQRFSQAESEYAMAVRYSADARPVITELVSTLSPDRAARAIPIEMPIESVLRVVRRDVAALWLERVLSYTKDIRAADTLYSLGMRFKDWKSAESGARFRCRSLPSTRCSLELAKVLMAAGKIDEVIEVLSGAPEWDGRRDEKASAWRLLCDARRAAGNVDQAAECERRLELSGIDQPDQ